MRLFFALWPDDALRRALTSAIENLKPLYAARWVAPAKLHMTLAFLGDIGDDRLEQLEQIGGALDQTPGTVVFDRLELWRSGVLCLVPSVEPDCLVALAQALSERLLKQDFRVERRTFRPHLTLARRARRRSAAGPDDCSTFAWTPRALCLVESRTDESPSRYEILKSWPLPPAKQPTRPIV